jgi:hypothetical protein
MKKIFTISCISAFLLFASYTVRHFNVEVPKTWDEEKLYSGQVPLANTSIIVKPVPEEYYYKIPERVIYKTYPMYMPGREPKGYFEWLRSQYPEIIFDPAALKTEEDWIKAGEIVFDMPTGFIPINQDFLNALPSIAKNWNKIGTPLTKEGIIPFLSIVVKEKGAIQLGILSCGMCHTKVMPDGNLLKGAQGNYPFDRDLPILFSYDPDANGPNDTMSSFTKEILYSLFAAPWIKEKNQEIWNQPASSYKNTIIKDLQASIRVLYTGMELLMVILLVFLICLISGKENILIAPG